MQIRPWFVTSVCANPHANGVNASPQLQSSVDSGAQILDDFRRMAALAPSFAITSHGTTHEMRLERADDAGGDPFEQEPSAFERFMTRIRSSINGGSAYATVTTESHRYPASLTHELGGRFTLQLWNSGSDCFDIALCEFAFEAGALHIYNTQTRGFHAGKGYNALLQRLAYILADYPRRIVMRDVIESNPVWHLLANAYLNSGTYRRFHEETVAASVERRFDVTVRGMRLLRPRDVSVGRTRSYELRVHPSSTFTIDIQVESPDARNTH